MASPSDITFECMLQTVQWVYQNRTTGLKFTSNSSFIPHAWYDASNDRDIEDSLCIGGTVVMMKGAGI
jgi:hypothetical protein